MQAVIDALSAQVAVLDANGVIVSVNESWRQFGRIRGGSRCVGMSYLQVCADSARQGDLDAAAVERELRRSLSGATTGFEYSYPCLDRVFRMGAVAFEVAGRRQVVVTHEDVTLFTHTQIELSALTEQLLAAHEDARRRIAIELHDSTSQHLIAIGFGLAALKRGSSDPQVLADMRAALAEAHRDVRTLSFLLHPPEFKANRVHATLRTLLRGFRRRTGLSVRSSLRGDLDGMTPAVQHATLRIVQEALTNVARHSRATEVRVNVWRRPSGLRVCVADNGAAKPSATPFLAGVGFRGMEARVRQFGGSLRIDAAQHGVRVLALVPAPGLVSAAR